MLDDFECAFAGVATRDPELKQSAKGTPYCSFTIVRGRDEAKQFVRVCAFSELAERISVQLKKGGKIYVEGVLDPLTIYTPENGEARININVRAFRAEVLNMIGRSRPKRERQDDRRDDYRRQDSRSDWQRPIDGRQYERGH